MRHLAISNIFEKIPIVIHSKQNVITELLNDVNTYAVPVLLISFQMEDHSTCNVAKIKMYK